MSRKEKFMWLLGFIIAPEVVIIGFLVKLWKQRKAARIELEKKPVS